MNQEAHQALSDALQRYTRVRRLLPYRLAQWERLLAPYSLEELRQGIPLEAVERFNGLRYDGKLLSRTDRLVFGALFRVEDGMAYWKG